MDEALRARINSQEMRIQKPIKNFKIKSRRKLKIKRSVLKNVSGVALCSFLLNGFKLIPVRRDHYPHVCASYTPSGNSDKKKVKKKQSVS